MFNMTDWLRKQQMLAPTKTQYIPQQFKEMGAMRGPVGPGLPEGWDKSRPTQLNPEAFKALGGLFDTQGTHGPVTPMPQQVQDLMNSPNPNALQNAFQLPNLSNPAMNKNIGAPGSSTSNMLPSLQNNMNGMANKFGGFGNMFKGFSLFGK